MNAVGIVAEYNPFHRGHAWHLAETRRLLGGDVPAVCVLSGNWVQRGECALTDKWTRAALALRGGADLVLELPTPWAVSSAEGFARGAVGLLRATGVVDALSFGSESGDLAGLRRLAAALEGEDYPAALHAQLDKGRPFAEARQKALEQVAGETGKLLSRPNDSLAVEYLRWAGEGMTALAVPRRGADHDAPGQTGEFLSASALRALSMESGPAALAPWVGEEGAKLLAGAGTASMAPIERAVLARLRTMTAGDWAALPDSGAGEGLPQRLVRAAARAGSLEEFYALAKTRRYAHARLRRLALWAFLGLTEGDRRPPACLRVLGMSGRGQALLREMKLRASLPLLTKPSRVGELGEEAVDQLELERRCTDLYGLCFEAPRPGGWEYTASPVILP